MANISTVKRLKKEPLILLTAPSLLDFYNFIEQTLDNVTKT